MYNSYIINQTRTMKKEEIKRIIAVLPCFNEEESLHFTIDALEAVRKTLPKQYSLDFLFVNDGSSDKTQSLLEEAAKGIPHIYYREFAHNVGHQSALRAGINASVGYDAVVMLDADMQHPPKLIPNMIKKWEEGYKVVQMIRNDGAEDVGTIRYAIRRLYYGFIRYISDLKLEYGASDFRIVDGSVAKIVANSHESHLFLRGYFSWLPVSRTTIKYKPSKRIAGSSKYSWRKLYKLTYSSILQFSEKPLHIAVLIGILMALVAIVYALVVAVFYLLGHHEVSGWTSLMIVMLFSFGINFILLGIIGHYMAHSINLQKQRPEFVVAEEKLPGSPN